jgi:hypothetical protein
MPYGTGTRLQRPWTADNDARLSQMFAEGAKVPAIATALGRTKGSIMARVQKLRLSLRQRG